jgi:DNA-directed RNA polymerase specialized sigma24 family protein
MESHLLSTIDNKCSEQASSTEPDRDVKFLAMLPKIRRQAAYYLRYLSKEDRADAVQEVVARAFVSYVRLIKRGKADLAFAGPLARYGTYQYLSGRRVGSRMNSDDITSDYCRQKKGLSLEQLARFDEATGEWEELVVEDRHAGPAEVATTRVDFAVWLESLPKRTRCVAETLATGEATSRVAQISGLTPGRVSQLRRELYESWRVFTGEVVPATASALA